MGSGIFTRDAFVNYSTSVGKAYSKATGKVSGQTFTASSIHESLMPMKEGVGVMRECANSDEHPNTIPVILGLDVTGSMGSACKETAEALGLIIENLYKKYKDIEFCIMGIGDLDYDNSPIQIGQFESDIRIAKDIDHIFMEFGGGGNSFESYTAAWYMGAKHTKLDCYDQNGQKGIIITMGDELLNPYLPAEKLSELTGDALSKDVETPDLFNEASSKFDIYHINVEHGSRFTESSLSESWTKVIGEDNYKTSTVNGLSEAIVECIDNSLKDRKATKKVAHVDLGDL